MAGHALAPTHVKPRSGRLPNPGLLDLERRAFFDLLRMANTLTTPRGIARQLVVLAQHLSGCEAVAIRLKDGPDFPYAASLGFPEGHLALEDGLCSTDEEGRLLRDGQRKPILGGLCGQVLSGPAACAQICFTDRGSFISSSPRGHLSSRSMAEGFGCTRNQCCLAGYETVGLFPIRRDHVTYGLIQCNDRRPGRLTPKSIDLMENLAVSAAHLFQLAMA
jgi:hypothetical protein